MVTKGARKLDGEMKLWIMKLMKKEKHGKETSQKEYLKAKKRAITTIYIAKWDVPLEHFARFNINSDKNKIVKLAKKL